MEKKNEQSYKSSISIAKPELTMVELQTLKMKLKKRIDLEIKDFEYESGVRVKAIDVYSIAAGVPASPDVFFGVEISLNL